jgi:hypothetical protein
MRQNGEEDCRGLLKRHVSAFSQLGDERSSAAKSLHQEKVDIAKVSLTRGQVNAVRAAWHHANPDCATVRDFPIERAEVIGIRQGEALKAGSGFAAC